MVTQIIDQSPSEIQLHRVLYVIKFLRAMVLHLILAIFAALVYFVAGIDGLYPIANNLIHALRAQIDPESASRRSDWLFGLCGSAIGASRHIARGADMDLRFDHKCPAFRAEVASGIDPDCDFLEPHHNLAESAICVCKFGFFVCIAGHGERCSGSAHFSG